MNLQDAKRRLGNIVFTSGEFDALSRSPLRGFDGSDPSRPRGCYINGDSVDKSNPANWRVMTDDAIIALADDMP